MGVDFLWRCCRESALGTDESAPPTGLDPRCSHDKPLPDHSNPALLTRRSPAPLMRLSPALLERHSSTLPVRPRTAPFRAPMRGARYFQLADSSPANWNESCASFGTLLAQIGVAL